MVLAFKSGCNLIIFIALITFSLFPAISFSKSTPVTVTDLLRTVLDDESSDLFSLPNTAALFTQTAAGSTDASSIKKVTLKYFTTTNCSAPYLTSVPTYTTPAGTQYDRALIRIFGLVATSAWNVGSNNVSPTINAAYGSDITSINSIAVTFRSNDNTNTPQSSFAGLSYACAQVVCSSGECIGTSSGTNSFTLKQSSSQVAIGDAVDGGIVACKSGGSAPNSYNLVTTITNASSGIRWGVTSTIAATSTRNGSANTQAIYDVYSAPPYNFLANSYAAGVCHDYTVAGGFTSGWFLYSGNENNATIDTQQYCVCANRLAINAALTSISGSVAVGGSYWSSTQNTADNAFRQTQSSSTCGRNTSPKTSSIYLVRCVSEFTA